MGWSNSGWLSDQGGWSKNAGSVFVPATWNPADKGTDIVLSSGNLTFTQPVASFECARATKSASSGKKYFEFLSVLHNTYEGCGIANAAFSVNGAFLGSDTNGVTYVSAGGFGTVYLNNSAIASIQTFAQGDTISIAIDLDNMRAWFRVNSGNWNNDVSANPATNTNGINISGLSGGPYFPTAFGANTSDSLTANFGASAYAQTPPSGFGNW